MEEVRRKFLETIEQFHMLRQGGRVVAAVSGGADSVCLLALLCGLRGELGAEVRAVHVHHGLRGAEADRDAEFVRSLCGELGVPLEIRYVDVRAFAAEQKRSEEEAGRLLRYQALEECAARWEREECAVSREPEECAVNREPEAGGEADRDQVKIAVAHHGDDQAETILHNLCRGSGLKGLGGMRPVRGRIIRPLIGVGRRDILEWLKATGLEYCEDSTNGSDAYTRNRIRRQLIPMLSEQVNPGAVDSILRMGNMAAQADDYLAGQAALWVEEHVAVEKAERFVIPEVPFNALPEILKSYAVFQVMKQAAGQARDLGYGHVDQVIRLFDSPAGHSQNLPYKMRAVRERGGVVLSPGGTGRRLSSVSAFFAHFSYKKGMEIPKNQYTKWFDCDRIKGTPVVRSRQNGDYITLADGHKKTIRRFMIDEKIPREIRDSVPLLADGSHVMWVIGYRISEYYKIGPDTVRVLEVRTEAAEVD